MHTLFGITLVLYLLKLSAGQGICFEFGRICYPKQCERKALQDEVKIMISVIIFAALHILLLSSKTLHLHVNNKTSNLIVNTCPFVQHLINKFNKILAS